MKTSSFSGTLTTGFLSLSMVVLLASCSKETIEPTSVSNSNNALRKVSETYTPTVVTPVHPGNPIQKDPNLRQISSTDLSSTATDLTGNREERIREIKDTETGPDNLRQPQPDVLTPKHPDQSGNRTNEIKDTELGPDNLRQPSTDILTPKNPNRPGNNTGELRLRNSNEISQETARMGQPSTDETFRLKTAKKFTPKNPR
jgi:hypothetical protein